VDQRVDDAIVATSEHEPAPEHRFRLVLRREFDRELAVTRLLVLGQDGQQLGVTETRQLEILLGLLEQALPRLRCAEREVEHEWEQWRDALGLARAE